MAGQLSSELVGRYSRPPSQTTVDRAIAAHESVRALLEDGDYLTFLQGSYKNDTALWDMNDVDIAAVSKNLYSAVFTGKAGQYSVSWDEIFARIERKLQSDLRYQGKWERKDKCIRLNTGTRLDIVPAVHVGDPATDPIALFSFRAGRERLNSPRDHYRLGAEKSRRTSGAYKLTVRLFKRWAKCWFGDRKVAPSFYLECLVHAQPDSFFTGVLSNDFSTIGEAALRMKYGVTLLSPVAGTGNLLTSGEWDNACFAEFQHTLLASLTHVDAALYTQSEVTARAEWVAAFNGQQPS